MTEHALLLTVVPEGRTSAAVFMYGDRAVRIEVTNTDGQLFYSITEQNRLLQFQN